MHRKRTERITYGIRTAVLAAVLAVSAFFPMRVHATAVEEYEIPGQEEYQREVQKEETIIYGEPASESTDMDRAAPSDQVDLKYSGPLDDRTGAARIGTAMSEEEGVYILKKNRLGFDKESGQYRIYCGTRALICSVPDEAILSSDTTIHYQTEEGLSLQLFRDGDEVESDGYLSDPGVYTIKMSNSADNESRVIHFTILKNRVSDLKTFELPEGFELTSITIDDVSQTLQYSNSYNLLMDGTYEIQWACGSIRQTFITRFVLDHTPPELLLPEVVDGVAKGPVSFTDLEAGETVYWKTGNMDGIIRDPEELLEDPGYYYLTVSDEAGNYTTYEFEINTYLDSSAVMVVLMLSGLVIGILIYSRRLRTHMRVG